MMVNEKRKFRKITLSTCMYYENFIRFFDALFTKKNPIFFTGHVAIVITVFVKYLHGFYSRILRIVFDNLLFINKTNL